MDSLPLGLVASFFSYLEYDQQGEEGDNGDHESLARTNRFLHQASLHPHDIHNPVTIWPSALITVATADLEDRDVIRRTAARMMSSTAFVVPIGIAALRLRDATISGLSGSRFFGRPLEWLTSNILSRVQSMKLFGDTADILRLLYSRPVWPFLRSLELHVHDGTNEHIVAQTIIRHIKTHTKPEDADRIDEAIFERMTACYASIACIINVATSLKEIEDDSHHVNGTVRNGENKDAKDSDGVCDICGCGCDIRVTISQKDLDRNLTLRLPVFDTVAVSYKVPMIDALSSVASLTSMDLDLTDTSYASLASPALSRLDQLKHLRIHGQSADPPLGPPRSIFPHLPHGSLASLNVDVRERDHQPRLTWTEDLSHCVHLARLEMHVQQETRSCELLAKNLAHLPKLTTLVLGLDYFVTLDVSALATLRHLVLLRASYSLHISRLVGVDNLRSERPNLDIVEMASDVDPFYGEE
jgi:hypothetical protein